jgi:hypothetical protein
MQALVEFLQQMYFSAVKVKGFVFAKIKKTRHKLPYVGF